MCTITHIAIHPLHSLTLHLLHLPPSPTPTTLTMTIDVEGLVMKVEEASDAPSGAHGGTVARENVRVEPEVPGKVPKLAQLRHPLFESVEMVPRPHPTYLDESIA